MRIFNKFEGTHGFERSWYEALRFRYMITHEAERRTRILAFWKKHGFEATKEAFSVSRRTLYLWKERLRKGKGKVDVLNPESRTPKTKRTRTWDTRILEEIKRLRFEHPNLGKEKLFPLLLEFCNEHMLLCPRPQTIGRIIRDLGGLHVVPTRITGTGKVRLFNRTKTLRKPKGIIAQYPGHIVALDTFEEHINGTRRYVITFEDLFTRFGFALATNSHASKAAEEFFAYCQKVFPFPIVFVLTDNGSEFKKHFSQHLEELHLTHYHTRPRTPKQNAHCERFNRTVQEEFSNHHWRTLWLNIPEFNRQLFEWLYWYNVKRVHFAFQNKLSPVQFMLTLTSEQLPSECKDGWARTLNCYSSFPML